MKIKKLSPLLIVPLGISGIPFVTLTSCTTNTCQLIEKNITGCTCYNGNAKFILKLEQELTDKTTFEFETTNIKVFDRFHQEITITGNNIFTYTINQSIDNKTVEIALKINQPDKIFSGCKVSFDFAITRLEGKNKQWTKVFDNCSVMYQYNLIIDDYNFVTYDQCNTGNTARYRIKFPLLKKLYRPNPTAIQINNFRHASLSDDYVLSNFARNIEDEGATVIIAFDIQRNDKKAFTEGEVIPFYLDLSYEDEAETENTWYEYIPYLYVKHTEAKVKEPEAKSVTITKPSQDYYQIFSLNFDFAGDYKIDEADILNISFSYPRGRDKDMGFFYLLDNYAQGGYKQYHIEFVSKISKDITVESHKLVFNVDFENITAGWKQSVPVMIDFIVSE